MALDAYLAALSREFAACRFVPQARASQAIRYQSPDGNFHIAVKKVCECHYTLDYQYAAISQPEGETHTVPVTMEMQVQLGRKDKPQKIVQIVLQSYLLARPHLVASPAPKSFLSD